MSGLGVVVWGSLGVPRVSGCLHPCERVALHGFTPDISAHPSMQHTLEMAGNAFSVPVAAAALGRCLQTHVGILPPRVGATPADQI